MFTSNLEAKPFNFRSVLHPITRKNFFNLLKSPKNYPYSLTRRIQQQTQQPAAVINCCTGTVAITTCSTSADVIITMSTSHHRRSHTKSREQRHTNKTSTTEYYSVWNTPVMCVAIPAMNIFSCPRHFLVSAGLGQVKRACPAMYAFFNQIIKLLHQISQQPGDSKQKYTQIHWVPHPLHKPIAPPQISPPIFFASN